jgi:hypothetical protein
MAVTSATKLVPFAWPAIVWFDLKQGMATMNERPLPAFSIGQRVRVVLSEGNTTGHTGTVRGIVWHSKDRRYGFYLEKGSLYLEADLKAID